MKIAELITESQVTDEGVLGSIASGIGTGVGAVAKGLGAVSGAFKGAKDQYQKGQALGRAHVGGHMPAQPADNSVRNAEFSRLTGKPNAGAPNVAGQDIAAQIKAKEAELADLKAQQKSAAAQPPAQLETPPATQPGIGQSSNGNNAVATNTAPADTKAPTPQPATPGPEAGQVEPTMDPAATPQPTAAKTAPAPAAAPAAPQKVDPAQLKANLAKNRNASAKSGFNNYVAGGKGFTAGPNGEVVPKVARESIEFHSKFLGMML